MEADSPRGRLYLMEAAMKKRIEISNPFFDHINLCLTCRACETACPSGVKFGQLMEKTRSILMPFQFKTKISSWLLIFILEKIVPSHRKLTMLRTLLWMYRTTGLQWLIRHTPIQHLLPEKIRQLEESLPLIPFRSFKKKNTQIFEAVGEKKGRVALFTGCVMDHLFSDVHRSTVRLLTWNGYEVVVPGKQTCCGALHAHLGENKTASRLAEINVSVFNKIPLDAIIVNAAGCSAHLKNYHVPEFTKKIKDLTEFLASIELRTPQTGTELNVVYDEPCHLVHGQGISREPKKVIRNIPGITLLHLDEQDFCCGSAGSYMVSQTTMSKNILNRKMDKIELTNAEMVITANPGCQIQLEWGIRQRKSKLRVLHIADLLDRAYKHDKGY